MASAAGGFLTVGASRLLHSANMANRLVRSADAATREAFDPTIGSPSRCPGMVRSSASAGRPPTGMASLVEGRKGCEGMAFLLFPMARPVRRCPVVPRFNSPPAWI
jgi:hypothetical protein